MQCHKFILELSGNSGVPSQANIGIREIIKWMGQQGKGHERHLLVRKHQNRGSFLVQTNKEDTANFLKTFQLEVKWSGQTYHIPLKPALPNKPRFWVRMHRTCDDEFYNADDGMFDKMLEEAGFTIVTPTSKNNHFASKIENGTRLAQVIRGDQHIGREHVWYDSKGQGHKWYMEYHGQPHRCTRGCNTFHEDGKCDAWERKKEQKSWEGQQKSFFVSSSLLKLAADTKQTRIDAIPGAKIGHLTHHINNDPTIFKQAEMLVVQAGANMDMGSVEKSKPHIKAQAEEMGQMLDKLVDADIKVFVVDPICGPWIKEAPGADHWAIVRSRMKKTAKKSKAEWISLEGLDWVAEEDFAQDGVHNSRSGTQKVMEAISARVKEVTGKEVMEGMTIQDRPYAAISRAHYRVGCHRCTRHHDGRECPPLPANADLNNSNLSNTTIQESFLSAGSDRFNASAEPSETGSVTPPRRADADISDNSSDAAPEQPTSASLSSSLATIESPNDLPTAYSVLLRSNNRAFSRSSSAKKRELEKTKGSPTDTNGKKPRTKDQSQSPKGHKSRDGADKQSKK